MEDKDKIEEILKQYPILRSKLNMRLTNLENIEIPISAISYSKVKPQKSNDFYSDVENYLTDEEKIKEEVKVLFKTVRTIESSLECLTKKEFTIIKYKFFEDLTYLEISYMMEKATSTLQRYKDQAVEKLKKTGLHEIEQKIGTK